MLMPILLSQAQLDYLLKAASQLPFFDCILTKDCDEDNCYHVWGPTQDRTNTDTIPFMNNLTFQELADCSLEDFAPLEDDEPDYFSAQCPGSGIHPHDPNDDAANERYFDEHFH